MKSLHAKQNVGDALAAVCGFVFFAFTVGIEKLNPRNVGWLTFGDQLTHWLGWRFYAEDSWRWPLGANPNYGWERMNSIVFTDSFPGLAVLFKAIDLEVFDKGQYFGIGFLVSAIALFVGSRRLFSHLGVDLWPALLAAALLGTTPLFWWMQRWYPALSSGVPLLVWAFYFYLNNDVSAKRLILRWSGLLAVAVAIQAYLVIAVFLFFLAALTQRFLRDKAEVRMLITTFAVVVLVCLSEMYVLGYYTVPSKWAQTGGYGWYSANVLGLLDPNESSRWVPDLPSISGQYEPTALSTGVLILLVMLVGGRVLSRRPFGFRSYLRSHLPLVLVLLMLSFLAITNTVSLGSWSARVPIPPRLEHALSIFRSSARFLWPTLIVLSAAIIIQAVSRLRRASVLLLFAFLLQVADYGHELNAVSATPNGDIPAINFDAEFWQRIPADYSKVSVHPAASLGPGWAECAFAALQTDRVAECGYFSRVQGLENVNRLQSTALLSSELNPHAIYWVSTGWLKTNMAELINTYDAENESVLVVSIGAVAANSSVLIFPNCDSHGECSFLGERRMSFGRFLRNL